jgi:tetratricopeptide (TPR) repeat protein
MRGLSIFGAVIGVAMLAGCASQSNELDSAWQSIVDQDYAEARAKYEAILAGDPKNPYAHLNVGVAYEELGDTAMAAQHYQAAIANGENAKIGQVAQDGTVTGRTITVRQVATENLTRLGG